LYKVRCVNAASNPLASIAPGQRWMSDAQPELGLGVVLSVDDRSVVVAFTAADETRRYAIRSAPLRRVQFGAGDTVTDHEGNPRRILGVEEVDGLLVYRCSDGELGEALVSDTTALSGPRERLADGRTDPSSLFDLRLETLNRLHAMRSSPLRGFVGARIELLPHQFFIASEVSRRPVPRVLLADETGLGKTIEAGLILDRMILTGRASRVLVVVPDSLIHQWLVELRRRFNLRFAIYDEDRCASIEESEPGSNPFSDEQLILAPLSLVTSDKRALQAAEAGWDLLVVDEAHHLEWSPTGASRSYTAIERIAEHATGLLLLTATPEQLGEAGHFARLRLLDPDRYGDFANWKAEAGTYRQVAAIARQLLDGQTLEDQDKTRLGEFLGLKPGEIDSRLADEEEREALLEDLIDRHGPGRVMFRNTRAAVAGFPQREINIIELDEPDVAAGAHLMVELKADLSTDPNAKPALDPELTDDLRTIWLVEQLGNPEPAKLLVLCRSAAKAQALKSAIETRINVSIALFHENLSLVQRDRNAAWFAEEDGARVLICSEIGSEGRNFQHASDLVMFDLPLDPDLVEQRIGRLDRIGQRNTVRIHVPVPAGTGLEVLARWHNEGVGAFARPTLVAHPLLSAFGEKVRDAALAAAKQDRQTVTAAIDALVVETAAAAATLAEQVEDGRDRLLEMASLRADVAADLIDGVRETDDDEELEDYFLRILEHFHVYAEEIGNRCFALNPDGTQSAEFPSLEQGNVVLAFERATALVREDLDFATHDHPLLGDAMELMLAEEPGNASFALLTEKVTPRLLLEAVFVLETVAPPRLHLDRFLAPTPVRVVIDQLGAEVESVDFQNLETGRGEWLTGQRKALGPILEKMLASAETSAGRRADLLRRRAEMIMRRQLDAELDRLKALAEVNDHVHPDEERALIAERDALAAAISSARMRPDALRLVWHGPTDEGAPSRL
jgi:ATP-dependent helicase HepA